MYDGGMRRRVLLGAVFLLGGAVAYYLQFKLTQTFAKVPGETDYYYELNEAEHSWKVYSIQPVVVGFRQKGGNHYLLTLHKEGERWIRGVVFLTGQIKNESFDKIVYYPANGEPSVISLVEFKRAVKIGQRVRIEYLGGEPIDWEGATEQFCSDYYPACAYPEMREELEPLLINNWSFLKPERFYQALGVKARLEPRIEVPK